MAAWMPASRKKYRSIRQLLMFPGGKEGLAFGSSRAPQGLAAEAMWGVGGQTALSSCAACESPSDVLSGV